MMLCNRFPAMTPLTLRRERFWEVVRLWLRLMRYTNAELMKSLNDGEKPPEGSFVIGNTLYTPAKDDGWY